MKAASSLLLLALASLAHADSTADEAFKRGRDLLKKGDAAGACTAFEESLRAEFQFGTLFNIAQCNERQNKLASAWAAYHRLAVDDTNAARRSKSAAAADALLPRVPRLAIDIDPPNLAGATIAIDGVDAGASLRSVPVDPGEHAITARAAGYRDATATAMASEGATTAVRITLEREPAAEKPIVAPPRPEPPAHEPAPLAVVQPRAPTKTLRTAGIATAVAGVVVFAGGVGLALYEKSVYDDAKLHYNQGGDPGQLTRANQAGAMADGATALCMLGGAATVVGAVLWWRSRVVVHASADRVTLAVRGTF